MVANHKSRNATNIIATNTKLRVLLLLFSGLHGGCLDASEIIYYHMWISFTCKRKTLNKGRNKVLGNHGCRIMCVQERQRGSSLLNAFFFFLEKMKQEEKKEKAVVKTTHIYYFAGGFAQRRHTEYFNGIEPPVFICVEQSI